MGEIFYQIITRLYVLAIYFARFFSSKAAKMWKGRKNQWKKIRDKLMGVPAPVIWFHCSSLGEFEQGRPVIEAIKNNHPDFSIVLTFFSPSGFEVRKNYPLAEAVFYLPFDSRKNANKFLHLVKPKMAFFIKYEYWHYYLDELEIHQIPTFSISSIFRPNQLFFKPQGEFYKNILEKFDHFFVQNAISKKLLNEINLKNVTVSGDTRFDRVWKICSQAKDIPVAEKFKNGKKLMVIGSSWPNDIDVLSEFINNWCREIKFIIAPHEIDEKNLRQIEDKMNGEVLRFSKAGNNGSEDHAVLIIDNMGMLSSLYRYGEFAYIGGAFDHGLHNTLEAASYGIPIFFGKGNKNIEYQEAIDLLACNAAFEVESSDEMESTFTNLYTDKDSYNKSATASKKYIEKNLGATQIIMNHIEKTLTTI